MSKENSSPSAENNKASGQTPSMFASLLVFSLMIGLILLAVFLFRNEVDSGPLQISISLALLFAVGIAFLYGYRGALVSEAITKSINSALGTIFILLAVGALIGSLYLAGTVPAFVYYGVDVLTPTIFYIAVFILCSLLSVMTGSSFTTVGALGVAFVGLASLMGVSPAIAGGAAVSGAVLGDKIARISDTLTLTTAVVGGVSVDEHDRMVRRTAIPAWILSAILFTILGFISSGSATPVDAAAVQDSIDQVYNISLLAFVPLVLVFILSAGFLNPATAAETYKLDPAHTSVVFRIKHLGVAKQSERGVELRVHPTLIPEKRLIANVDGVMNAVLVKGDAVGATLHYGAGAATSTNTKHTEPVREKGRPR